MDTMQTGIITLLKSAVTGVALPLPEGFDIEAAYPQIKRHHMATMVYDGAVRCGISRQLPAMQQLLQSSCKALLASEGQMRELSRVFAAFDENGIDDLPLKGCNMKALYPSPELRMMGDADVLIRMEQYGKIEPILELLGFRAKQNTDHELVWQSDGLYLELHKYLIPSYYQDLHAYFGDGWKVAKRKDGTRYAMTPEDELVYLFAHFTKHFRAGGIGCRHIVDLWVYLRANPGMDGQLIESAMTELHLERFYENIKRLLGVWFEGEKADPVTELITDYVFGSGSWGTMESRLYSTEVLKARSDGQISNSKLKSLGETLFPPLETLRMHYNILYKHPWLLPFCWVARWVEVLVLRRRNIGRKLGIIRQMSDEKVTAYRQVLNDMGLDLGGEGPGDAQ